MNNESVTGDHISFSKNSYDCYDSTELEDCKYCIWMHQTKNSYDCHGWGLPCELGYENHLTGINSYNVRFSESCWDSVSDLMYCRYCLYKCSHLFGCVGLQRKSYCILNKQYSKEDYEKLVPKIIEHMKGTTAIAGSSTGEWGEFFPVWMSPFGYNETEGIKSWPLSKDEALVRGMKWKDEEFRPKSSAPKVDIPYHIKEISDDILEKTLACEDCGKEYKIIAQELKFYRKTGVPVPHKCHDCRYEVRVAMRSQRQLFERECDKCGMGIKTTYSKGRHGPAAAGSRYGGKKVYCEKCYLEEVY